MSPRRSTPPPPPESQATVRAALRHALRAGPRTAHELSARVRIAEKQVAGHLEHLARSLRAGGERLRVEPARCLDCGFVFRKRDRLSRPSRCPVCRSERLDGPRFSITPR
ncbi:MAG: transcriptional regulator [Candidatus Rokuibacteriota bacterium]